MAISSIGPSTPETPYLVPTVSSVGFTSILSAGDEVIGATNADVVVIQNYFDLEEITAKLEVAVG